MPCVCYFSFLHFHRLNAFFLSVSGVLELVSGALVADLSWVNGGGEVKILKYITEPFTKVIIQVCNEKIASVIQYPKYYAFGLCSSMLCYDKQKLLYVDSFLLFSYGV